jgi:hypothetical protein
MSAMPPARSSKVVLSRIWMFEHSDWFKPYVAGYYANWFGFSTSRDFVNKHINQLIMIGQGDCFARLPRFARNRLAMTGKD